MSDGLLARGASWFVDQLEPHAGEDVTYQAETGDPLPLTAIVGPDEIENQTTAKGTERRRTVSIVLRADAALPEISYRGTFTLRGELWAIADIDRQSSAAAVVQLIRRESAERTRENYRGDR
jgi:hypothetical protein